MVFGGRVSELAEADLTRSPGGCCLALAPTGGGGERLESWSEPLVLELLAYDLEPAESVATGHVFHVIVQSERAGVGAGARVGVGVRVEERVDGGGVGCGQTTPSEERVVLQIEEAQGDMLRSVEVPGQGV